MTLDASTDIAVTGTDEFSLSNSSANALAYSLKLRNPAAGAASTTGILFQVDNGAGRGKGALVYAGDGGSWNRGDFMFLQNSAGGGANASLADAVVTIKNSGAMGIGTTVPGTLLDVAGAITSRPYGTATGETGQLIMRELAAGGTDTVAIRAPDAITTSYALTLPDTAGSTGQVLRTDGAGILSWVTAATAVADDSLDFDKFIDAMTLDTSTDIAASGTNVLSITNTGTGDSFRVNDQAADSTPFVVDAGGNVGIGTTTPTSPLEVNGVITATAINKTTQGFAVQIGGSPKLTFWNSYIGIHESLEFQAGTGAPVLRNGTGTSAAPVYSFSGDNGLGMYRSALDNLSFATSDLERIRIDSNGLVGLGTSVPGTILDAAGAITSRPHGTAAGETGKLIMRELAAGGTDTVAIRAPDAIGTSYSLTLPATAGSANQVLATDGAGLLSWVNGSADNLGNHTATQNIILGSNYLSGDGGAGEGISVSSTGRVSVSEEIIGRRILARGNETESRFGFTSTQAFGLQLSNVQFITARKDTLSEMEFAPDVADVNDLYIGGKTTPDVHFKLDNNWIGINRLNPTTTLDVGGEILARPKGTLTGETGSILFAELVANGSNTASIRAPDTLAADYVLTLPTDDGTSGQVLQTNGSGVLSWVSAPLNGGTFLAGDGSVAAPSITFQNDTNSGFFSEGDNLIGITVNGNHHGNINNDAWSLWRKVQTGNCGETEPCFSYTSDSDNGMFFPATNTVGFSTNATEKMRIDSSGNIGIGTTSPGTNTKLSVEGQIRAKSFTTTSGAIDWGNGNSGSTSYDCSGNITFANLRDGGSYTIVVTSIDTTMCGFSTTTTGDDAATVSYRFYPANSTRTASSHTIYSLQRIGTTVYVSWITGF